MVFYILMMIILILIGASFFLWTQWNRERSTIEENINPREMQVKSTMFNKPKRLSKPKEEKKQKLQKPRKQKTSLFGGKKSKSQQGTNSEDEISWDNFGIVERDKESSTDQSDMDSFFGFKTKKDDGLLERMKEKDPKKNLRIEDEFPDLFSDEEKKANTNNIRENKTYDELLELENFKEIPNITESENNEEKEAIAGNFQQKQTFDEIPDFKNFEETPQNLENKNENEDDAFEFLSNYNFDQKESLDDDIFERARNQKDTPNDDTFDNESESNIKNDLSDEDWDFSSLRNSLYGGVSEEKFDSSAKKEDVPVTDAEDDDIFARLQRLSNMMDQQKK